MFPVFSQFAAYIHVYMYYKVYKNIPLLRQMLIFDRLGIFLLNLHSVTSKMSKFHVNQYLAKYQKFKLKFCFKQIIVMQSDEVRDSILHFVHSHTRCEVLLSYWVLHGVCDQSKTPSKLNAINRLLVTFELVADIPAFHQTSFLKLNDPEKDRHAYKVMK